MSSPPPLENPFIFNLMPTFGAAMVGSFMSTALWGVSTLQVFLYYMKYETDPTVLKALVSFLWALDTANVLLTIKGNFRVPILSWGDMAGLDQQQLEFMDHTVVESVVVFAVQMYFIRRIYMFNQVNKKQTWIFPAILTLLASWQVVGTIVYQVFGYGRLITTLSTHREVSLNMSLRAVAVAVDLAVAVNMVYLLLSQPTPQFARSKRMVHRLVMLSINSGLVTAVVAITVLVLLAAMPNTLYYLIPELSLCTLYFSTFMANLNARRYIRGETETSNTFSGLPSVGNKSGNTPLPLRAMTYNPDNQRINNPDLVVKIQTESRTDDSYEYKSRN